MEDLSELNSHANVSSPPHLSGIDDGKDEMNFAEFPLAAIADRLPDNQKTLVFEDKLFDSGKSEMITRRLTISASDKYGLPTARDDEVILGLIQLTRQNRFAERRVSFSRYQLIQVLGWRHEGRSYERLEKSLMRWIGVTLYYDKAWWDKEAQSWVNESFHILENVTLYDQQRRLKMLRSRQADPPLSSFTWNEVVFRSFKSGYLRTIDLGVFRKLQYAAAKRMYRFLDKRFYHKPRWEFDLQEFACEHVGLGRNYDTGQLKRRLQPAVAELESVGFLEALSGEQRYVKIARGEWRIVFVRKAKPQLAALDATADALSKQLIERGVTPSVAIALVKDYPADLIETQIEVLDRLQQTKRGAIRNPAGYLVKAIREGYAPPKETQQRRAVPSKRSVNVKSTSEPGIDPAAKAVKQYLASLSDADTLTLEAEALKHATPVLADGYCRSKAASNPTHEIYRRMILEREVKKKLDARRLKKAS